MKPYQIKTKILPVILGGTCLYVYICFSGQIFQFLVDSGYTKIEISAIRWLFDSTYLRKATFLLLIFIKDIISQISIVSLLTYFFSARLIADIRANSYRMLLGSLLSAFIIYRPNGNLERVISFSYSPFCQNYIVCFIFNSLLWYFIFYASILLTSKIYAYQAKEKA